jgi:hypothetical protein
MMSEPSPINIGIVVALVEKPIVKTTADSFPTNFATVLSSSSCTEIVPISDLDEHKLFGHFSSASRTSLLHVSFQSSANPR